MLTIEKKQAKIIIFITLIITIIFVVLGIVDKLQYNEYNEVDAKVVDFYTNIHRNSRNKKSIEKFIKYEYEINGKKYISSRRISSLGTIKHMERLEKIKYNPQNPEEIEDTYKTKSLFMFATLFGVFTILLSIITLKNRRI